jgi:hypothetical protein
MVSIVCISPETGSGLALEARRSAGDSVAGGLLFGYPVCECYRQVVGYTQLRPEVLMGKGFSLDQSQPSRQLVLACQSDPQAQYCGAWTIHHTPEQEPTEREWVQARSVLEDPGYHFDDLVCLVLCSYAGELQYHAWILTREHAATGRPPEPANLLQASPQPGRAFPSSATPASPAPAEWYKSPDMARRLYLESLQLAQRYRVKMTADAGAQEVVFHLTPGNGGGGQSLCVACGPDFPRTGPVVFVTDEDEEKGRRLLYVPGSGDWLASYRLLDVTEHWLVRHATSWK